jgi:hypothetical protein
MHVLITAVGKRTEHWTSPFEALTDRPDVRVTVYASDVSALIERALQRLDERHGRFRSHLAPHLLGEGRTGHMASVLFATGSGRAPKGEGPNAMSTTRGEFAWPRITESLCRIWRELSHTADDITGSAMTLPMQLGRDPVTHSAKAAGIFSKGGPSGDLT